MIGSRKQGGEVGTPPSSDNPNHSGMALLTRLWSHAKTSPGSPAVRTASPRLGTSQAVTYAELVDRVAALATHIDKHTAPESVVALALPSGADFAAAYLAVLAAERIVHPIPQNSSHAELLNFLKATNAALLITGQAAPADPGIPSIDPSRLHDSNSKPWQLKKHASMQSPGLYLPSSGTTGMPKIAARSRAALDAVARNVANATSLSREDRVLAAVPMSHSYGMENGLLGPIWAGSCIHILDKGSTEPGLDVGDLLNHLIQERITVFPAVPFMIDMITKLSAEQRTTTSLRLTYTAGSALPAAVAAAFRERFGLTVAQLYGATELGSITFGTPDTSRPGSWVGFPVSGMSVRILDSNHQPLPPGVEGEVAIRADSMLSHYLGKHGPDRSAILDGHFLTGDLGELAPDGSLNITGRLKLLIDIGGFKVNPMEVERVLCQHPSIGEAVVIPITITDTVSRLKAIVTPRNPGDTVPIEDVRAFVRSLLAPHKVPRLIDVVDRLPKSPTGKILRRTLEHTS